MCATHDAMGNVSAVNISCEMQPDAPGRFLFVAANVDGFFHLAEVEVFNGKVTTYHIMDIITE